MDESAPPIGGAGLNLGGASQKPNAFFLIFFLFVRKKIISHGLET